MGNGTAVFDTAQQRYFIDLFVTANYDADAAAHSHRWQKSFEAASDLLFKATDGRMQFGKISYLNNGPVVTTDDVRLKDTGHKASTDQGPLPFVGHSTYVPHVMKEPLIMLHECGHYVVLLFDEYVFSGSIFRKCQGNPATHECIMEFGRGVGLLLDNSGNEEPIQPNPSVKQYCFSNHQPNIGNQQHDKNKESCWHTLKKRYPLLAFPGSATTTNTLQPLQWEVRSVESKFAIVIPSNAAYGDPIVSRALKSAIKHYARHISYSGDQLAIAIRGNELLRPMARITLADLVPIFQQIDQTALGQPTDSQQMIDVATGAFRDRPGAYQTMILLAPADSFSVKESNRETARRHITLNARVLGRVSLDQDDGGDSTRKWLELQNLPVKLADLNKYAFALQNELLQTLYSRSPGLSIVDMCLGRLPRAAASIVFNGQPARDINLEQRDIGFDFPVWIEPGASAVTFLLSEPQAGNLAFTLINPAGQEIQQASPPAGLANNIRSYYLTTQLPGRWILRLTRSGTSHSELPFFLLAASTNRHVSTNVQIISLPGQRVKFRSQLSYDYALDRIQATVEIYHFLPDAEAPGEIVSSAVLHRQRDPDFNDGLSELSKGWYEGELKLETGDYIAHFRWHNGGAAMYISNPSGITHGEVMEYPVHYIPTLSRIQSQRFEVRPQK